MINLSRRQLAHYAADQLLSNHSLRKVSQEMASVLVQTKRANQAELLARDIAWELEQRGKVANAHVTAARNLSDNLREQITAYVKKAAKVDQVVIDELVDESVIGGIRIDTAMHSWDKTLKRELTDIQEAF